DMLRYFVRHLDAADADVAADAFLEVARSSDVEIAQAARELTADRLRRLLGDPQTPRERIGLFAFLLACHGVEKDAVLLRKMLEEVPEDRQSMRRGLLAGYMILKPRDGWALTLGTLADSRCGFLERYAALGVLEFFHNWKPGENRQSILKGL